ncbi:MAG: hypothetical protein KC484_00590 [Colwelliaceae bacterium]|nr:hypothetical protein [Colwelliaceae bacterium]
MKSILIILSSLLFLAACSTNNGAVLKAKNLAFKEYITQNNIESVSKVTSFKFHGWNSLTDEFLIISSSPKRKYLLELTGYCSDIRWAHAIIINRSTNSSLHAKFDSISTTESPRISCIIKTIYPLTKEQLIDIREIDHPKDKPSSTEVEEKEKTTTS